MTMHGDLRNEREGKREKERDLVGPHRIRNTLAGHCYCIKVDLRLMKFRRLMKNYPDLPFE